MQPKKITLDFFLGNKGPRGIFFLGHFQLDSPTGNAFSTDIDECVSGADNCDANAACTNTPGGFTCTCNQGYTGDGTSCTGKFFLECQQGVRSHADSVVASSENQTINCYISV
jgi:hypothetical protein